MKIAGKLQQNNRNGGYCAGFRAQLADVEVFSHKLIVVQCCLLEPERWFFANSHAIRKCK